MSDIAAWLENLGLDKYVDVFVENEIDFAVLPDLPEQDLVGLGDRAARDEERRAEEGGESSARPADGGSVRSHRVLRKSA